MPKWPTLNSRHNVNIQNKNTLCGLDIQKYMIKYSVLKTQIAEVRAVQSPATLWTRCMRAVPPPRTPRGGDYFEHAQKQGRLTKKYYNKSPCKKCVQNEWHVCVRDNVL